MVRNGSSTLRSFLPGLYPVAVLFAIVPLIELVGETLPVRPSLPAWRISFLGQGFGLLGTWTIGIALVMVIAAVMNQRGVLRAASVLSIVSALAVAGGMARFLVDYSQVQSMVPVSDLPGFEGAAFRALVFAVLAIPVLLVLGGRGLVAARRPEPSLPESTQERARSVIPFPGRTATPAPRWPHR